MTTAPRIKRTAIVAGQTLALVGTFAVALVGGAVLHLNTEVGRSALRQGTNYFLGNLFEGRIIAGPIEHIGWDGVTIERAVAEDPRKGTVIVAEHLRARADIPGMLHQILWGEGPINIEISEIEIDYADVLIEAGPNGDLTIAETFTIPEKLKKEPAPKPSGPSRAVRVLMPSIAIHDGIAHGRIASSVTLDADVTGLRGGVFVTEDGVFVDAGPAEIVERGLIGQTLDGTGNYQLKIHFRPGEPEDAIDHYATFDGTLSDLPIVVGAQLRDDGLRATIDVPTTDAAAFRELVPGLPLDTPASVTARLEGPIAEFAAHVRVALADGSQGIIDADAHMDLMRLRFGGNVVAEGVDPRVFGEDLPHAAVYAEGSVIADLSHPSPELRAEFSTQPAAAMDQLIPPIDGHATLHRGELTVRALVHETGMPILAEVHVDESENIEFFASAAAQELALVPRIAGPVRGAGEVTVRGRYTGLTVDAELRGRFAGVSAPDLSAGGVLVEGRVSGPIFALGLEADASVTDARAMGIDFDRIDAHAEGPLLYPRIEAQAIDTLDGTLQASGRVSPLNGSVDGISIAMERDGLVAKGTVASIRPSADGVALEGIALEGDGLGKATGGLRIAGGEILGKLSAEKIDLGGLGKLLGIAVPIDGVATVDIDLERTVQGRTGHLHYLIEDGQVMIVRGISAQGTLRFDDDEVETDAIVRLRDDREECAGTIATVRLTDGKLALRGPLLSGRTWENAVGEVEIAAEQFRLDCLTSLVPLSVLSALDGVDIPISGAEGTVNARLTVLRDEGDRLPSVEDLYVRTEDLAIYGPQGFGDDEPAWTWDGIDGQLTGSFDGALGELAVKGVLFDGAILLDGEIETEVDLDRALDPKQRADALKEMGIYAQFSVPRRPIRQFSTLPPMLSNFVPDMEGEVRLDAYVDGTPNEPFATLNLKGFDLGPAADDEASAEFTFPIDLDAVATYDTQTAALDATFSTSEADFATLNAQVEVALADVLTPPADGIPWSGGAYLELDEAPIGRIPALADRNIGGHLSGELSIAGLGERPTMDVDLSLGTLQIGPTFFADATLTGQVRPLSQVGGAIDAAMTPQELGLLRMTFDVETHSGGELSVRAYSGIRWEQRVLPTLDYDAPADLVLAVSEFPLSGLYPLVSASVSELDGLVDGQARLGWNRIQQGTEASVLADLHVTSGVVHIPQLGQELKNASVDIVSQEGGIIRFDNVSAEGIRGRATGNMQVRLDGLVPEKAVGELNIAEGEEIPITFEGVPLGRTHGRVVLSADIAPDRIDATIGVPSLEMELPASTSRAVEDLSENPDFELSHPLSAEERSRKEDAIAMYLTIDLGSVRVRGTGLEFELTNGQAPLQVALTDKARPSGEISVQAGRFDVFGKSFDIRRGLVRLRPEESGNPYLNVTALWEAPGGGQVFVDYVGNLYPVTKEKLRFRSNPPRSERDILAVLLFGGDLESADPSTTDQTATAVAAGVTAGQFNALFAGIAPLRNFSIRPETTEDGQVKNSLVYQSGDTIASVSSYQREEKSTSTAAQASQGDGETATRTEVSIEWKFSPKWSLRGTFGAGAGTPSSGVDLIWQHRY